MERIYEVTLVHAYDYDIYYVRASDVGTAASLALQADAATPAGVACRNERDDAMRPRVKCAREWCSVEQIVQ